MSHKVLNRSGMLGWSTLLLYLLIALPAKGQISDDFCDPLVSAGIWTVSEPGMTNIEWIGSQSVDAQLEINLPAGTAHEMHNSIGAPHLLQAVNNTDFSVEVKFESSPQLPFQEQGILVKEDDNNFLRVEFFSNNFNTFLFVRAYGVNANTYVQELIGVNGLTPPLYLRLNRDMDTDEWSAGYSFDGSFTEPNNAFIFSHSMTVSGMGPYAGNAGLNPPAYTALIDYFYNLETPLIAEDDCSCSITSVSVPQVAECNGEEAFFNVTFDVSGGSGNYNAIDVTNGNQVLGGISGLTTTGTGFSISVCLPEPLSLGDFDINVVDANDAECIGLSPQTISVNACMAPEDCALLPDGLVLHLEADVGIVENSGSVSTWSDQSGRENDLQGFGDPQLIICGGPNGRDYISLDGIDDKLEQLFCLYDLPIGNADRTVFLIARYNDNESSTGFAYGAGSDNRTFGLISEAGTGQLAVQGFGAANDQVSGTPAGTDWLSQSVVLRSNEFFHYKDGVQIDNGSHLFDTGGEQIIIGEEISGTGSYLSMDVAAILVYDRALHESERQYVESYLQEKYFGVSCIQSCAIYNVSASDAVCNGDNAVFTVSFDVLDGSGNYNVVDVNNGNQVLASLNSAAGTAGNLEIPVIINGPTTSSSLEINVVDAGNGSCLGNERQTINIPVCPDQTCKIANVCVAETAACNGSDVQFIVFFDVTNGSGNYQVIDLDNGNQVIGSITGAAANCQGQSVSILIDGPTSTSALNFDVIDAADPAACVGVNSQNIIIPSCPQATPCNVITNVSAPLIAACNSNDAQFNVSFDVTGGSGDYQVVDVKNGNLVLGSLGGAATTDVGLVIPVSLTAPVGGSLLLDVMDANNPACLGESPELIQIPACPAAPACNITNVSAPANAYCVGLGARFVVTFDVTNGSGDYEVFDVNSPSTVLGTISSSASSCAAVQIEVEIPGPLNQNLLMIDVRDSQDNNCSSGNGQEVVIPTCPAVNSVAVAVKVMLQGPFDSGSGLMQDLIRTSGLLPASDPYGYGVTAAPALLEDQADSNLDIVDWVRLELRREDNLGDPTVIVDSTVGLVRRNGEVISPDGSNTIYFQDSFVCDYYLAVFQRNHLAVMTSNSIMLNAPASN